MLCASSQLLLFFPFHLLLPLLVFHFFSLYFLLLIHLYFLSQCFLLFLLLPFRLPSLFSADSIDLVHGSLREPCNLVRARLVLDLGVFEASSTVGSVLILRAESAGKIASMEVAKCRSFQFLSHRSLLCSSFDFALSRTSISQSVCGVVFLKCSCILWRRFISSHCICFGTRMPSGLGGGLGFATPMVS